MSDHTTTADDVRKEFATQANEAARNAADKAAKFGHEATDYYVREPAKDLISLGKAYAKDHPDVAACWAFGLGIVVGWKLKP